MRASATCFVPSLRAYDFKMQPLLLKYAWPRRSEDGHHLLTPRVVIPTGQPGAEVCLHDVILTDGFQSTTSSTLPIFSALRYPPQPTPVYITTSSAWRHCIIADALVKGWSGDHYAGVSSAWERLRWSLDEFFDTGARSFANPYPSPLFTHPVCSL